MRFKLVSLHAPLQFLLFQLSVFFSCEEKLKNWVLLQLLFLLLFCVVFVSSLKYRWNSGDLTVYKQIVFDTGNKFFLLEK